VAVALLLNHSKPSVDVSRVLMRYYATVAWPNCFMSDLHNSLDESY